MASQAYSNGVTSVINGTIDTDTTTTKMGLAQSSYNPAASEQFLDVAGTAQDFHGQEATCTGYTGGFAGAGRKTATVTVTQQSGSSRAVNIFTNLTWTALGGASNNTLRYVVWLREITDDTASIPIAFMQFTSDLTTNGSDVTVSFDASNGNVRWTV